MTTTENAERIRSPLRREVYLLERVSKVTTTENPQRIRSLISVSQICDKYHCTPVSLRGYDWSGGHVQGWLEHLTPLRSFGCKLYDPDEVAAAMREKPHWRRKPRNP